jgi:Gylcosyl hydrolase family 115 C-terminal domain
LIGFPVRVVGSAGLIFMADRAIQQGTDVAANQKRIEQLRAGLEAQVANFNTNIAEGKWNRIMPGLVTGKALTSWSSQVRWPWGETATSASAASGNEPPTGQTWRDAATADREIPKGAATWSSVEGLGPSGRAMALQPESLAASWKEDDTNAPSLKYNFASAGGDGVAIMDFLPTFRIYPGMKLRVAVSVDNQASTLIEVPGSSGAENENGTVRSAGVQDNYTRARIPLPSLAPGKHTFTIRAVDPGAVIDRVSLPGS